MGAGMLKVILIDKNENDRASLKALLSSEADIKVIGDTASGASGVEIAIKLVPDVLVADILTRDVSGILVMRQVHLLFPQIGLVVLSEYASKASVGLALWAGAKGYVVKGHNQNVIVTAIRRVALGESYFYPSENAKYAQASYP